MKKNNKSAIALKYDKSRHSAPQVTAKGDDLIAEEILRLAEEFDVPIYEDPELTMALAQVELGDEIPETLYLAIAEVIAFVYQLENKKSNKVTPDQASRKARLKKHYS
ncbi:EscU/YscU/HrcU family type III secretion system export apparatus switch protein [Oceanospirillum sediminis]|uniref:Flagellar biosynthetic protein FlhB n=1 Tax=Oceanospirillum sediminis TaxID=2760088 RepID=A0A839IME2_9GAMM|nr:EscU/YscU/HrcU family type III secretion system export apparatus switch protein [Oceanospirillum sediminis]MBB1485679.1 EscU/YscU/HrcU family type III secretion system export apparatus switch protein [Oceanospirillum sediminis]